MKKVCSLWLVLLILLSILPVNAAEETADPYENVSCYSFDATNAVLGKEALIKNADSILVYEKTSNTLMYTWNADDQVSPASLVKIMTGLIVSEQGDMDQAVTVNESVLSEIPKEAATIGLQPEEVITVGDLLYCMMVSSANDAAAVLADHIAGSQEAFVAQMNDYAAQLGCTGTNFTNVHGLHDDEQYTTVRDMGKILSKALDNEQFRTVFGTEKYTVEPTNKSEVRYLVTGNYLMSMDDITYYYDSRVKGGRTGVTNDGYRNIAVCAKSGTMELICILTGAESTLAENGYSVEEFGGYSEVSDLLDMSFDNYQVAQVVYDGQVLTQMPVDQGECDVVLGPATSVLAVLPAKAAMKDLVYRYPTTASALNAPIKKGDLISNVEVWYKTLCVAQADLYAMNDVEIQQISANTVSDDDVQGDLGALWTVLGVIFGVVIVFVMIRTFGRIRRRNASRRSRRNRRRSR